MRSKVEPNARCPCGSGFKSKRCHRGNHGRLLPITPLITRPSATNYSHPKCYARCLNDCSDQISAEHAISRSILDTFGAIEVNGYSWQEGAKRLPSEALTAKILCTNHNTALSGLDTCAGRLFRILSSIGENFRSTSVGHRHEYLSGEEFERWSIKLLCGSIAAGQVRPPGGGADELSREVPEPWIRFLFGIDALHSPMGLYITKNYLVPERPTFHAGRYLWMTPFGLNGKPAGFDFGFAGFPFQLVMNHQLGIATHATRHPEKLLFVREKASLTVEFSWETPGRDALFDFRIVSGSSGVVGRHELDVMGRRVASDIEIDREAGILRGRRKGRNTRT